ncbi:hypothetical protein RclHR1_05840011 [Rhizophagus clarus]|uniref:Uncharacterized protein n=1 Tax=Rhizophagus clarus TaxID=94130 RepID=A0A2Z6S6E0_9GLOM|nr:hypothetical protein RclHR1_05840011 [Rhizophagus clarus]GES94705.1 hypothetical protein RCL_e21903_RclHR1_05840011 [Rhizophagus clarus]
MTSHHTRCSISGICDRFVTRQFGKREITILPFVIELLKFYHRCMFTRSTSLLRVRKADLKAVFDFTYKQLILSSLPIISKIGFGEKNNRPKVTFKTSFSTLGKFADRLILQLLYLYVEKILIFCIFPVPQFATKPDFWYATIILCHS